MIETQTLGIILLGLRLIATGLIVAVVIRQIHNIKTLQTQFPAVRYAVLAMTVVILLGQGIPLLIDASAAFDESYVQKGDTVGSLLALYTLNNAAKDVVVGSLLAFLHYRIAPRLSEKSEDVKQAL